MAGGCAQALRDDRKTAGYANDVVQRPIHQSTRHRRQRRGLVLPSQGKPSASILPVLLLLLIGAGLGFGLVGILKSWARVPLSLPPQIDPG
jgi:hypothetical protein